MRIVPIKEVLALDIGEKVPSTKGKIKKVFPRNEGTNAYGNWSIQNVEITEAGATVKVKLFDFEEIPKTWENRMVYVQSAEGDKGIKGVEVAQDKYKWIEGQPIKKLIEVKQIAGATFTLDDSATGSPAPAASPAQPAHAPAPEASGASPGSQTTSRTATEHPTQPSMPLDEARRHVAEASQAINRNVMGFALVMRGVDYLQKKRTEGGKAMTPEQFQGTCTTIFIQLSRAGLIDALPTGDLDKWMSEKKD